MRRGASRCGGGRAAGRGGPWLSDFDPRTGLGVITGVTTFRYTGHDATLYSADLGPVAKALYERALSG